MSVTLPTPSFQSVTLGADPVSAMQAVTKEYVDVRTGGSGAGYLPLTGGTISPGPLAINPPTLTGTVPPSANSVSGTSTSISSRVITARPAPLQ